MNADLHIWNRKLKTGIVFEASAGFFLPDSSMKSPNAAWLSYERWNALEPEQRTGFAYLAPDFIIELASPSDSIVQLKIRWKNGVIMA